MDEFLREYGDQPNEAPSWVMLLLVIEGLVMLGKPSFTR